MEQRCAVLPENVRLFVVQGLACFDPPSVVAEAVEREFGLSLERAQVESHDPTHKAGRKLGKRLRAVFEATRQAFLEDAGHVAIAHRAVRLRVLNRLIAKAEERGEIALAARLLELAAKEAGEGRRPEPGAHEGAAPPAVSREELAEAVRSVRERF